jgi:hypothetical protein
VMELASGHSDRSLGGSTGFARQAAHEERSPT